MGISVPSKDSQGQCQGAPTLKTHAVINYKKQIKNIIITTLTDVKF